MEFVKSKLIRLERPFFERPAELVARELLGTYLTVGETTGKIVETEAYVGEHDLAAHSSKGRTPRTEVMFGPGGHAYVYFIYGMHWLFNVVTGEQGSAAAVLLRALEPVGEVSGPTDGPAKFTKVFLLTGEDSGVDLVTSSRIFLSAPDVPENFNVTVTPRINVAYAGEWAHAPLRFYITGNPYVSRR
jgi:DNA-3-methyladenine glycosylase